MGRYSSPLLLFFFFLGISERVGNGYHTSKQVVFFTCVPASLAVPPRAST
jgi:hypothetical protein